MLPPLMTSVAMDQAPGPEVLEEGSDIEVGDLAAVLLDEVAAVLDVLAHEHREQPVRAGGDDLVGLPGVWLGLRAELLDNDLRNIVTVSSFVH